jgi:hypothetical protein
MIFWGAMLIASLSSFGGGFELMKAGGDKDGVWTLLESAILCVSAPSPSFYHLIVSFSHNSITGYIPYVRPILHALERKNGAYTRLQDFGRERVLMRLEAGAKRKDLVYHLVRTFVDSESDTFTSLGPIPER